MGSASITRAGFDSAAVAPAERFEAWRASMAPGHEIGPVAETCSPPSVASTGWTLDSLVLSDLAFSPITYRRCSDATERVLLRLYLEGHGTGMFADIPFRTAPGEIHLFDQAPASQGVTADWHRLKSVFIPYAAIGYRPGRHPAHLRVGPDSAVGRVLRAAIEALFAELPRTRSAEAPKLAAGFAGLVRGLLLTTPSASDMDALEATRRTAMRRYLEEHLVDTDVGVASLCAAFNASRATVYRSFADDGGVARFIARRRLEHAFSDLAGGPPDRGRVRRVAERWGFACPYHFSRAFRGQFGLSPSEVCEARGQAPPGITPPPPAPA